jgi:hypothetical protein
MPTCAKSALSALLLASSAFAQSDGTVHVGRALEIFVDQDQPFVNAGYGQGLKVGSILPVAGGNPIGKTGERRDVGSAKVVELWENLARLQLDGPATAAKGKRFVRVNGTDGAALDPVPPPPLPATPAASAPLDSPTPPPPTPGAEHSIQVHASMSLQRLYLRNDGKVPLHKCELRLPDNRHYVVTEPLAPQDEEAVMLFRFSQDGLPMDRPLDYVLVKCVEGEKSVRL